jgi:hypothetical protein
MTRTKVALVGIGKIALDQHVPALNASPDWELAATVSRSGRWKASPATPTSPPSWPNAPTSPSSRSACPPSRALPMPRPRFCRAACHAGKPPGATLAEVHALEAMAKAKGLTLYATWHSRMAHAVAPAKAWLADKTIKSPHHLARGRAQMAPRPGLGVPARRHGRLRPRHQRPVDPDRDPAQTRPPDRPRWSSRRTARPHRRAADLLGQRHRRFRLAAGRPADLGHRG